MEKIHFNYIIFLFQNLDSLFSFKILQITDNNVEFFFSFSLYKFVFKIKSFFV